MSKIVLSVSERWVPDGRVEAIADFANRMHASILVVHVAYGTEGPAPDKSAGERVLEQVAQVLKARQLVVETLLLFSDSIPAAVVKTASEHGGSMILLGLSSKGMLARLIEGNVAQEIIKTTRVPVLLLPPDWKGEI
ncbi:MAG: universal stress protein [Phycisphaerae bacterium]